MIEPGTAIQLGSTVLNAIKGIGSLFGGKSEEEKAREELSRLKTPFYKIQDEYIQNRNIAGSMASSGLPDSTKNYYTTEAQRGLGSSLNAVMTAGGNPNDVNRLLDVYNNSINKVAAEDAQEKIKNIQNFMNVNREVAGQKTMQWSLNEYTPYQRKLKEITERIGAAKQNQNNAFNNIIGSVSAAGTALSNNDLMSRLFGNKTSSSSEIGRVTDVTAPVNAIPSPAFPKPAIQPVNLPNLQQSNNQNADIYNPNVNPYAPNGGFWDGNQWVP